LILKLFNLKKAKQEFIRPVGVHDIGICFTFQGVQFEIVEFRSKATKSPYVAKNLVTGEKVKVPLTDHILKQIRNGNVTEIR
jgi:hypothetical protein